MAGAFNGYALNGAAINGDGGGRYYLALDAGSVALTGSSAALLEKRPMPAGLGSLTLTGSAASLKRGARVIANASAYALISTVNSFNRSFVTKASAGTFAETGSDAALKSTRIVRASGAAYASQLFDARTLCGRVVRSSVGAYDYSGFSIDMRKGIALAAFGGSALADGSDAITAYGRLFQVDGNQYTTGYGDAGVFYGRKTIAETGAYTLSVDNARVVTGMFEIVLDRTFGVKSETRTFAAANESGRDKAQLSVTPEIRIFKVPTAIRTFVISGERGI